MASKVEILNSAFNKLGAATIVSLTDDTKEGILANQQYDIVRQDMLSNHPWNFAISRVALASTGNTPAFEFDNEFAIPNDVLRILNIEMPIEDFRVESNAIDGTRVILSNFDDVKIKYIRNIEDVSQFPPYFVEAMAARFAAEFAFNLTGKTSVAKLMFALSEQKLRSARGYDAQEGTPEEISTTDSRNSWLNARY